MLKAVIYSQLKIEEKSSKDNAYYYNALTTKRYFGLNDSPARLFLIAQASVPVDH